jgi:prolyl oligopeptidase
MTTRTVDVVEDLHGVKVPDPYRWLEDPDAPEARAWIEAQNKATFDFLSKIPAREPLRNRITDLWDYEKFGIPFKKAGRYFFTRNDGLQNQAVLYVLESIDAEPRVLLDPNTLSPDGTVALVGTSVSEDGKLIAYGLASKGSDWTEWKVREIDTGRDRDDRVFPAHSFKFAARLQACHASDAPVLIRIDTKAGHGMGKPTAKLIDEAADRWAFVVEALGVRYPP